MQTTSQILTLNSKINYFAYLGLCSASLDSLIKDKDHFLSSEELAQFDTMKHSKRQHSYLLGRKCVKDLLQKYFNIAHKEATVVNGEFGQPIIVSNSLKNYAVSISHWSDLAAVIIFPSMHPMGIDIEGITKDSLQAVSDYLTPAEIMVAAGFEESACMPLVLWSAREAASKIFTCGIGVPKHIFAIKSVTIDPNGYCLSFNNFFHIKSYTRLIEHKFILSIALPINSNLKSFKIAKDEACTLKNQSQSLS